MKKNNNLNKKKNMNKKDQLKVTPIDFQFYDHPALTPYKDGEHWYSAAMFINGKDDHYQVIFRRDSIEEVKEALKKEVCAFPMIQNLNIIEHEKSIDFSYVCCRQKINTHFNIFEIQRPQRIM